MYCLDTSIVVSVFRGDKELKRKIELINPEDVFVTTVSLCELFRGAYKTKNIETVLSEIESLTRNYSLLTLDATSSEIFGLDSNKLEKNGKQTRILDLMIASIAKANNLTLVTRNKKHFENIPGLKTEEW